MTEDDLKRLEEFMDDHGFNNINEIIKSYERLQNLAVEIHNRINFLDTCGDLNL